MKIKFYKYQATGNDFILIDDRKEDFNLQDNKLIQFLCSRRFGVGSDGLILLRNHKTHDFEMIFFNSTGEKSTFCGNGARCIVSFAHYLGIFSRSTKFIAYDGEHTARIDNHNVQIKMQDIKDINVYVNKLIFKNKKLDAIVLDTGSPHLVTLIKNLKDLNVLKWGKRYRYDQAFGSYGINVNFAEINNNNISIRTYERGDEMESLSCGTGSVATAIALFEIGIIKSQTSIIKTTGGELTVNFKYENNNYNNIWLSGEALMVYLGEIEC